MKDIRQKIIDSYQTDSKGFIVHDCEQLKKIYAAYGVDSNSINRAIFDLESLAHFFYTGVEKLFRKLEIRKEDKVLSLGEGNGTPSRMLAKLIGCHITGVDINPDQVDKAKKCAVFQGVADKVGYYMQNVAELDLPEKDYDKAYCNETVCHWQRKDPAFQKIYQHLKKGARIGINEWTKGDKGDLNDAYEKVADFKGLYQPGIWFQLSVDELAAVLEKAGFMLVEKWDATDEVDIRLKAKLKGIKIRNKVADDKYEGMVKTTYDYCRYATLIMEK
jgi:ubiquinone/menaquinone biosynthesis C-methylase UbiE